MDRPTRPPLDGPEARALRRRLVDTIQQHGVVSDPRVLDALRAVPRHAFAPTWRLETVYEDQPQAIGFGQTISQPTIVGMMSEALALTGRERVLEIGTGSGYQAAVLARLAGSVWTIERIQALADGARARLAELGISNVHIRCGDGFDGWPERAPFERIVVTAAPDAMPPALVDQLADGGVLVAPVGAQGGVQRLIRLRKRDGALHRDDLGAVRFVPMLAGRA